MSLRHDILADLAGIAPSSALAAARQTREAATRHAQGSYDALFTTHDETFSAEARFSVAAKVAKWHNADDLAAHYAGLGLTDPTSAQLAPAIEFARLLTFSPVKATPEALKSLQAAGWSAENIVTLAQLIAFVSFQSRLLAGLRLLNGKPVLHNDAPVVAGSWHTTAQTRSGKAAPVRFTQQELGWEPWIAAKQLEEFSVDEQAVLARFGHSNSDYFRLLGRNLPVLEQRTLTDKGIFYTPGGLPRAERELAATVASKVNGCIYCASVHARKTSQLSKADNAVETLLAVAPGGALHEGQSARWQAEIDAAAALSVTPPALTRDHISRLESEGLDTLEQLDLIQSAAFFAWANRLMLTLGEPFLP